MISIEIKILTFQFLLFTRSDSDVEAFYVVTEDAGLSPPSPVNEDYLYLVVNP